MLQSTKMTALALCIGAALLTGCASAPKKTVATPVETAPTSATPAEKPAAPVEEARTGALNNGDALAGTANGGNDAGGRSGVSGKGAKGGGAGDAGADNASVSDGKTSGKGTPTLAQLLATRLVHFDYDSADLRGDDYQTLLAHAQYLKKNPNAKVTLSGHADERGTREYNMALGERRAKSVEAFLTTNGAAPAQLDTVSYGKEKPVNDGHDEAAWAENRRVEISYDAGEPR